MNPKKPERDPDIIIKSSHKLFPIWFEEKIIGYDFGNGCDLFNLDIIKYNTHRKDEHSTLITGGIDKEIKRAYYDWQFNKKIKDLLSESEGRT